MTTSTTLPSQVAETYCRQEKRARIARIAVDDPNWRDWADLIAGPAGLIADRLLGEDVADYLRFRAVCRGWQRCTTSPHEHGTLDRRFHPRRWIMLPPHTLGRAVRKRRDFINVSTGQRIQVDLPELSSQYVFGATSDGGLIVLCRHKRTHAVRLLNPLTRQLTSLPPATTLQYTASSRTRTSGRSLQSVRLHGAGLADDSTVALHLDRTWLVTAKPGDTEWTKLQISSDDQIIASSPFAGRFYCVTQKAIMAIDATATATADRRRPQLVVAAELGDLDSVRLYAWTVKLVDNGGELIFVHMVYDIWQGFNYKAHRVDLEAGIIITLPMQQGLGGGRALFTGDGKLGPGPALLLSAGLSPYIRADIVYRCDSLLADPPEINAYSLCHGAARSHSAMEEVCAEPRCLGVDLGDAPSCSVIESVSRYVCGSKIIRKQQRHSERLALRRRRPLRWKSNPFHKGGQSQ